MRLAIVTGMRILVGLAALPLAACMVGSSPCDDAAAKLVGCDDAQRQAFVAACEASGEAPAAETFEDAEAACKAAPTSLEYGSAQSSAMTGVCVAAMYGVKWGVTALSPTAQPLSAQTKAMLRPLYGSLVDDVNVSIGAKLPPRVVIAGHELAVQPDAMTFGTQIFMLQEVADDTRTFDRLLLTTTHELTHARQAQQAGGFYGFAVSYCRDMIASGFDYSHIGMEVAAYAVEDTARRNLRSCGAVTCP